MSDVELCYRPATELVRAFARRELSPVDVTRAVIARAETVHAALNIFAFTCFDEALAAARASETRIMRGEAIGPLEGVPITIKDNLPTVGLRMTNGSFGMADFAPETDAVVWSRLREAGAILIGKTTLPEFAHKVLTDSPMFGITRSPWSPEHTPGGSSGGTSAAVAAGVGPLSVGTDGGGSIRCPASCAGLVGIKPTLGRIPFESFPEGFGNYAFTGPLARTVDDTALGLAVMSGPTPTDPHTLRAERMPIPPRARKPSVKGLRIGWIAQFGGRPVEAEVAALTGQAIAHMARDGATVEPLADPIFADVFDYYVVIATTAHAARLSALADTLGDRMSASLRASVAQGQKYSATDLLRAADRRTALFRAVQKLFERYDLIATPTMNAPPKPLDAGGAINTEMFADWACALYPFNLTGHPAASVPCGFTQSHLPVGLQLIGPWYGEDAILDAAAWLEQARPWAGTRPLM